MSSATLRTKVRQLAGELASVGFVQDRPFQLKRRLAFIDHFIELQPGHGHLAGKFTCNLCWKLTADGIPAEGAYTHAVRIGFLTGWADLWFSHDPKEALESSYREVMALLREKGIPFLDSLSDLRQMVHLYESAVASGLRVPDRPTSPLLFFGLDEGWKHYNLGFAYNVLGDPGKAREHFSAVIQEHSAYPYDWVRDRKNVCVEALRSLSEP